MEENLIFEIVKIFVLLTTPVTFFIGIFLLFDFKTYVRLEKFLSKTYLLHRDKYITWLDQSKDSLHLFLIAHRHTLGFVCLLNTVAIILVNFSLFKKP